MSNDPYQKKSQPEDGLELWDACASKHKGNSESRAANLKANHSKAQDRERVLEACRRPGGVTCKELAAEWEVGMNNISGRFTELKAKNLIQKIGTRDGSAVMTPTPQP